MTDPNRIRIFDTTLRDGEQSPGATMNAEEKVVIARQLEKLNVDVIEAGFAVSSPGDFDSVARVAGAVTKPIVLSLARTRKPDIEQAIRSVAKAKRPGIHLFIATSDLHLKAKLGKSRQEVLEEACWAVRFAREHLDYIEFSAEDASRSDRDYLVEVFYEVIGCGARVVNVPDTTGYAVPGEFGELFRYLITNTANSDQAIWSAHCHNDLGMAVSNSLAAVQNGARQIECTINGIGERAGNTSLEEVAMALDTRAAYFGLATGIVTEQIYPTSQLLAQVTGLVIPANKPIVGANAFSHEAGIHQDGVLKNKLTYEIMRPEKVGIPSNRLVLGKHSGRHAFVKRLEALGIDLRNVDIERAFQRFKALADQKKVVHDEDLFALVTEEAIRAPDRFELVDLKVSSSTGKPAEARIVVQVDGEVRKGHGQGDGMVDACYAAITMVTGINPKLERYGVKAITGGPDALGEVYCMVREDGLTVTGQGTHTDTVHASALALLNALNKLEARRHLYCRENGPTL